MSDHIQICCAMFCTNTPVNSSRHFFELPHQESEKIKWLELIGQEHLIKFKSLFLCDKHFSKSDLNFDRNRIIAINGKPKKIKGKKDCRMMQNEMKGKKKDFDSHTFKNGIAEDLNKGAFSHTSDMVTDMINTEVKTEAYEEEFVDFSDEIRCLENNGIGHFLINKDASTSCHLNEDVAEFENLNDILRNADKELKDNLCNILKNNGVHLALTTLENSASHERTNTAESQASQVKRAKKRKREISSDGSDEEASKMRKENEYLRKKVRSLNIKLSARDAVNAHLKEKLSEMERRAGDLNVQSRLTNIEKLLSSKLGSLCQCQQARNATSSAGSDGLKTEGKENCSSFVMVNEIQFDKRQLRYIDSKIKDSLYVKELAIYLWGAEELKKRCVTGVSKDGRLPLSPKKLTAIRELFKCRLEGKGYKGMLLESQQSKLNRYLAEKINDLRRSKK